MQEVRDLAVLREPTAIALAPDGRTLIVGSKLKDDLLFFKIAEDGSVTADPRKVTLERPWSGADDEAVRLKVARPNSANLHGLCTDADGRIYAATSAGVQVFDADGKPSGILWNPSQETIHAITLAGDVLYICAGKTISASDQCKRMGAVARMRSVCTAAPGLNDSAFYLLWRRN